MHFFTALLVCLLAAHVHGRRWGGSSGSPKAMRNSDCCMICPEQFYQEASQFLEVAGGGTIDPARHSMIMSRFGRFYRHHTGADMDASLLEISRAGAGARTGAGGIAYQRYNVGCCNVCPDLFERSGSFDVALLDSFARASYLELDYREEARNLLRFTEELVPLLGGRVYVPWHSAAATRRKVSKITIFLFLCFFKKSFIFFLFQHGQF